jgi:hypothetical protein
VSYFKKMGDIGIAGAAELVAMTLGSYFIGAADGPGIFGGTVFTEFFEKLLEARFELADDAVTLEA